MEAKFIDDFNILEVDANKYYPFYPTRQHEMEKNTWWGPGREIISLIEWRREYKDKIDYQLLWG